MKTKYRFFCVLSMLIALALVNTTAFGDEAADLEVPLFTLKDQKGNDVSLEAQRGKVVMINFWATWCPPCIKELPTMIELKESLADKPFEILAINMGEEPWVIEQFLAKFDATFNFPLLLDSIGKVATAYKVSGLPATMLVDKEGRIAFGGVGERDWNDDAVKAEILPLFE